MKQFNNLFLIVFSIIVFASCQNGTNKSEGANENPEAFQNQNIIEDVSSYSKRGYSSLTEKLYAELLEKNEELKKIEANIKKLGDDNFKKTEDLNKFLANNSKYYRELKQFYNDSIINIKSYIVKIKDSTLREQIRLEVEESEKKYTLKIDNLEKTLEELNKKVIEMEDYKIALKISLTLNSIEKYQDNFKQDTTSINSLIKKHEDLIGTIKNKIETK